MKRVVIFALILLLSSVVLASDFSLEVNPTSNVLFKGEKAVFDIDISNNADNGDSFRVRSSDLNWMLDQESNSLSLEGKKTGTLSLSFTPLSDLKPGKYGVVLTLDGETSSQEKVIHITLIDPNKVVSFKFINPEGIDPRRPGIATLQIKNNYELPLKLKYTLESDLFKDTKEISLDKIEEKEEQISLSLDPSTQEGNHNVSISVYLNDKLIEETSIPLLIKKYDGLREIVTPEESFLISKEYVRKVNEGNALVVDSYVKELTFLEKLFTRTNPKPDSIIKEDNKYTFKWDINLNPQEAKEIDIVTDYRTPLIVFILLILLGIYAYSTFKRHVEVTKKILTVKAEGGSNKAKVLITIKNKTGKMLKNVKVMEVLPHNAGSPGEYGTASPSKIIKQNGTLHLLWTIPQLSSKEERVLSYKISTKSSNVSIEPTLLKYNVDDKTLISKSNGVSIST